MEIEETPLYYEIDDIRTGGSTNSFFKWVATFHVNDTDVEALKVVEVDFSRDYENNFAEECMIKLAMLGGTFFKDIYPYQDNIDITLYKVPMTEAGVGEDESRNVQYRRYKAVYVDRGNPLLEMGGQGNNSKEALDLTQLLTDLEFQLIDKNLDQMRMKEYGTIFRNDTPKAVIVAALTEASRNIDGPDNEKLLGVDIVEPSNTKKRDSYVMEQRIRLVDIPKYIQNHCGGVYGAGLGHFYQGLYWFVYPRYDTTRYDKSNRKVHIVNVPANKYSEFERTFKVADGVVTILANGDFKFSDYSNQMQGNLGNGVRFADADKFVSGLTTTAGNKTKMDRSTNNNEFVSSQSADGNNNVLASDNPITANPFVEYTKLAQREGSLVLLEWRRSNDAYITPGVPCRISYLDGEDVKELDGVILKAHTHVATVGQGMMSDGYFSSTVLAIFVQRVPS